MTATPGTAALPEDLRSVLDARFRDVAFSRRLGIEVAGWGLGHATVRVTPAEADGNLNGLAHGALLFALADAAFEIACNSYARIAVGLETSTHYVSPAPVGRTLVAEAVEVSRSRRVASYRIEVRDADGPLRAWVMAVAFRTDRWHVDPADLPPGWEGRV